LSKTGEVVIAAGTVGLFAFGLWYLFGLTAIAAIILGGLAGYLISKGIFRLRKR